MVLWQDLLTRSCMSQASVDDRTCQPSSCASQLLSAMPAKCFARQVRCGLPAASAQPASLPAELHVEAGMRDITDAFKFWSWALKQLPGEDPIFNCTRWMAFVQHAVWG